MKKTWPRLLVAALVLALPLSAGAKDPVDYVNPLIGTHGPPGPSLYGGQVPGVTRPFGMIQWTAMTRLNAIGVCPYRSGDPGLIGFIGTRQPTVWMGDYGSVSIMPGVGPVVHDYQKRQVRLDHRRETSTPYYYAVAAGGVTTEIAAAERSALFRISFPDRGAPYIVIDASRDPGFDGWVEVRPQQGRVVGFNSDRQSASLGPPLPNFKGWFTIEFDQPIADFGAYNGQSLSPGQAAETGETIGAYVVFADHTPEVRVRIGTSLISLEQAEQNLQLEVPDWDLDRLRDQGREAWDRQLSRIQVEGGTEEMKTNFYTAMYHAHLYPRVFSEYGRYYSAFDDQVHPGVAYNDYSLWDTFRAEHPLLILTASERVSDMVTSLLQMFKEGGWLPKWPNPTYTGIMIGSHSDSVIADAWVKGIRDFDLQLAYQAVHKNAFVPPDGDEEKRWEDRAPFTTVEARAGLTYYMKLGYVPVDQTNESVSNTLEYAYDDFCVAQLAAAVGADDDYAVLMERTKNYQNLYHQGYFQGRRSDGSWAGKEGYTESLHWGYLFFALQDVPGLIELMGGNQAFARRLDQVFVPGLRLYRYLHQNEPEHHYIYLYDYCGQPWKAQKYARWASRRFYHDRPSGLLGNDDCGQMSAWYVFSSIGFYPVTPGTDLYAIGSPQWDRATIEIGAPYPRATFTVTTINQAPANAYIQSAELNGEPLDEPFLHHADIVAGGELVFVMGPRPNQSWGVTSGGESR